MWLDERYVAHLGDFDSAIPAGSTAGLRPITTNSFAAPEELEGGPLDGRSDLYSLGGVLYAVATGGRRPDEDGLAQPERRDFPSAFADLVTELQAASPDDRPADAATVLERLNEIRHTSNVGALIASGESDNVELKSSLHHAHGHAPGPAPSDGAGEVAARTSAKGSAEAAQSRKSQRQLPRS